MRDLHGVDTRPAERSHTLVMVDLAVHAVDTHGIHAKLFQVRQVTRASRPERKPTYTPRHSATRISTDRSWKMHSRINICRRLRVTLAKSGSVSTAPRRSLHGYVHRWQRLPRSLDLALQPPDMLYPTIQTAKIVSKILRV